MRVAQCLLRPHGLAAERLSSAAVIRRSSARAISSIAPRRPSSVHHDRIIPRQDGARPRPPQPPAGHVSPRRSLVTLAIETSCDDTCVAVLERHDATGAATLHFNAKVTSDSRPYGGVHPTVAIAGHTRHLAPLVREAITHLPSPARKPDFVSVTRGPGMAQNLAAGLNTAKGLAAAWDVPLLGVNHMQAHALTPRLVAALDAATSRTDPKEAPPYHHPSPSFPFLSLLVSGGHTMLVLSSSLTTHRILVPNLSGLALGDMLDKAARALVPQSDLDRLPNTMYAAALEPFAFPPSSPQSAYHPPATRRDEIAPLPVLVPGSATPIATLTPPLSTSRRLAYDFAGLGTQLARLATPTSPSLPLPHRRALAGAGMRLAFEHLASRVVLCLAAGGAGGPPTAAAAELARTRTLVVAGGVARNGFLRRVLRAVLDARGYGPDRLRVVVPPPELCTDNAAMIGWAGVEMWEAGWRTELDVLALRKWPVDPAAEGGGILGADGWVRRDGAGVGMQVEEVGSV